MAALYLDSSAIVKLAIEEPESGALRGHLRGRSRLLSSAVARAEVLRALMGEGEPGIARGRAALARLDMIRISDRILKIAGSLKPSTLRPLDAIHLATAMELGRDLGHIVTYDDGMAAGAEVLGLQTASPR